MKRFLVLCLLTVCCITYAGYKPIVLSSEHNHDKWNTEPDDIIKHFRAYTVSFDGVDDSDGDGDEEENDKLGIPEWVAYQINKIDVPLKKGPNRPTWFTDNNLSKENISPKNDTYTNSGFERGHMCMKHIAWRLGENADYNTHTTLNACPQMKAHNNTIWRNMEEITGKWANKYTKIWVICGPIIYKNKEIKYIGDPGEKKIPIPHAFFKIVIKENKDSLDILAFIYPHKEFSSPYNHAKHLVSVNKVEAVTGLDFLTSLPDDEEDKLEAKPAKKLWDK